MLYLIDTSIAEEAREALITKFEDTVKNLGGTVVSTDKWGAALSENSFRLNF